MSHPIRSCRGACVLSTAIFAACVTAAQAYTGEELAAKAKITIDQARRIALKAHPGKITDEELEHERGGSGLRYTFEIRSARGTQEVGIDATTGAILQNQTEGKTPD